MFCYLYEAPILFKLPIYLFYTPDLPPLLYYSHIPTTLIALLVGLIILLNAPKKLLNRLLFLITLCFALWAFFSLNAWTNINADYLAFTWTFFAILPALMSILSIYFIYVFVNHGSDITNKTKLIFIILLAPVFIFAPTSLHISGFDLINCDAFAYEGIFYKIYYNSLGFLAMGWIFYLLKKAYGRASEEFKKQIILMGIGIEFFLFSFITTIFTVTTIFGMDLFDGTILGDLTDTSGELYGLFGMTVFMAFMGALIVRFKVFNVGILAAQALVISLLFLVGSQYTYVTTKTSVILTSITLILTSVVGLILVRNVKREVDQRKEIADLAERLSAANARLKKLDKLKSEFVSIASHQLRSPLTSIRGYASMLVDGSYGNIPFKARKPLERIEKSAGMMALSVEDFLSVSRIESGNMVYDCTDFNIVDEVSHITDDVRQRAIKKGLLLSMKTDIKGQGIVHADLRKVQQIIHNLINNAFKYTPKGSITVYVHDDLVKKKIYVEIIDTGIGIKSESLRTLFQKFSRAENASDVNVEGTGLGLFVAQQMALAMDGDITAHSEGLGKGSHFILQLPLQM